MSAPAATLVDSARALATRAAEVAEQGERDRRLDYGLVEAISEAGLFRMLVPASVGGLETDPATMTEAIEELARGDAAAAWVVAVCCTGGMLGAYIEPEHAREVYGSPGAIVGGVFAPKGRAVPGEGGLTVNGRWAFASGVDHCDWLMGGCLVGEGDQVRTLPSGGPDVRLMLVPRDAVEVVDTWHVSGLRATGSHDMVIDGVRVPEGRSASLIADRPREEGPLYAFPVFGTLAISIAAVTLGIGRAALDDLIELAGGKLPSGSRRTLADRGMTQARTAQAEAGLAGARAFLRQAIGEAWESAVGGGDVSVRQRAHLRLAATHATAAATHAVDTAYELGAGSSIYESSPLQRRFRDVHAATAHMLVGPATWELAGRVLLGLDTDAGQL